MSTPGAAWVQWRVRLSYPLAAVFLWLATPSMNSLYLGAGISALGLLVRGAAAGHLRKHEALATTGPYAYTRNPLYLGSALLALGLVIAGRSWIAGVLVGAYFGAFYSAVMKREEAELRERYGAAFEAYARQVPLFVPAGRKQPDGAGDFSWKQFENNREYQASIGWIVGLCLLAGKMFFAL
ncbi:MAG: isoprenylcysteine carboxylmethyltransferase family protein [Acidobacteria bacterium]|nr:isoprenylcysteine carboxylmethyltransferase family protein [Acidobacteriota bacterium]